MSHFQRHFLGFSSVSEFNKTDRYLHEVFAFFFEQVNVIPELHDTLGGKDTLCNTMRSVRHLPGMLELKYDLVHSIVIC